MSESPDPLELGSAHHVETVGHKRKKSSSEHVGEAKKRRSGARDELHNSRISSVLSSTEEDQNLEDGRSVDSQVSVMEDAQKYVTAQGYLSRPDVTPTHYLPQHVTSPTPISLIYPQIQPQFFAHNYTQFLQRQHMMAYTSPSTLDGSVPPLETGNAIAVPSISPLHSFNLGRFKLREQPHENQRKSYKNENRCILPNPLTIAPREPETLPRILLGNVTVRLVNSEGKDLPSGKQDVLTSSEGLAHALDDKSMASFSLKVTDTSEGGNFRLLFIVSYTLDGIGPCEERILSQAFVVHSNRKKANRGQRPSIIDMKGTHGPTTHETEVWIKGKGFSNKVVVAFGDKQATITEVADNLLTVMAPARPDILQETKVPVIISNKFSNDLQSAEKKLYFTYIPPSI